MKMNGRVSAPHVALVVFVTFVFVFQIKLSSFARVAEKNSKASQVIVGKILNTHQNPIMATISCDRSHSKYDICSINGPTVLDPVTSTFYTVNFSSNWTQLNLTEKIRPYPRKSENFTMSKIKEVTLTSGPLAPLCEARHNAPALVFSAGGYTGNFFHDINDGFLPLFVTVNTIYPGQDFVLVVLKSSDWWVSKYAELLKAFTKHTIVNMDTITTRHCFPSATIGLISHGFMKAESEVKPNSRPLQHFQSFLGKAYGGKAFGDNATRPITTPTLHRPRLVLACRSGNIGRVILNQNKLKSIAEEEGFEVIIFDPKSSTPLRESYSVIHSSHVMVGVHGATLTHLLFLRSGSVFIQIVPIGTEWVSDVCFGAPARDLGLEYMEYKIEEEESSLGDKYGKDSMWVKNPKAMQSKGWSQKIMDKYLKEQNVKLDFDRFRGYLKTAYGKAKIFIDKEG